MKQSNDLVWLVVVGLVIWYVSQSNKTPSPAPSPNQGLAAIVTDAGDRAKLSVFYHDFAEILNRDTSVVKTTGQFREAHKNALTLMLVGTSYPRYPGLDQAVSERIKTAIQLDDTTLDANKKAALVSVLNSISSEFGG